MVTINLLPPQKRTVRAFHMEPGQRFGRLTMVGPDPTDRTRWMARCDCGKECSPNKYLVRSGKTRSCGCLHRDEMSLRFTQHGLFAGGVRSFSMYKIWSNMLQRCNNPKNPMYRNYGGRGIRVCQEWQGPGGMKRFIDHMGPRPSPAHTVDRKDNNGNYEPCNVRWATDDEQRNNTRRNHLVTMDGRTQTLTQWCVAFGTTPKMVGNRTRDGWTIEDAIKTPSLGIGRPKGRSRHGIH